MIPIQTDVLVAGGGPAGLTAALAAARNGVEVLLCQDRSVLGGNASSEVRMHIVGADCSGGRGAELETEARETGIIEEIRLDACVHNPQRSSSMFDLILYDKCRREKNLTLMLNTAVAGAEVDEGFITHAIASRNSTEETFRIEAKYFIDCTGDGGLGKAAGAHWREGREAASEFGESLAVGIADNKRLGSTLMFQARKHDCPMPFVPPPWARKFSEEQLRLRPHATAGYDLGLEYGFWWVEWGGTLDTIRDNEQIRDELLAILLGVWDHIKNDGDHGAGNWALQWCGFLPGKRESRRFVGEYTLTQNDLLNSTRFEDAIAYGGWHIDTHPPEGVDAIDSPPCTQHNVPHLFDIPLRACVSSEIQNLMFAGRNISATHIAFASTRVMATCSVVGQGVGTAAAVAVKQGIPAVGMLQQPDLLNRIQQQLLRDGAFLIGVANNDTDDLARQACITASSEQEGGEAARILSGQTRSVHGPGGAAAGRVQAGTHRWMSDPREQLPAWIELRWPTVIHPRRVQLVFDTGLHRVLTFSLADGYTSRMVWGRPQPETVRSYRIDCCSNGSWQTMVDVQDNHQRRRSHDLAGEATDALRVVVTSIHGLDHARICEIRVYESTS